jgi:hypothetical protein
LFGDVLYSKTNIGKYENLAGDDASSNQIWDNRTGEYVTNPGLYALELVDCYCPDCDWTWLGNGFCNPECNTQACNWDHGDCLCHLDCNDKMLETQDVCDPECDWFTLGEEGYPVECIDPGCYCDSAFGCHNSQ